MRRRELVAACGASLASLAGCLGGQASPGTDRPTNSADNTEGSPTPTGGGPTESDPAQVSITDWWLQPGVVTMTSPDSIGVRGSEESQSLFVSVATASGTPPERTAFAFRFDGAEHAPVDPDDWAFWRTRDDGEDPYDGSSGTGWLLFELPDAGNANDAALTWDGGEWTVGGDGRRVDSLRARLREPAPSMTVDVSIPEAVTPGTEPTVGFTVTNEGERTGRFVGAVTRSGPQIASTPVGWLSKRVGSGETATFDVIDGLDVPDPGADERDDGETDFTHYVYWPGGEATRHVRVVSDASADRTGTPSTG